MPPATSLDQLFAVDPATGLRPLTPAQRAAVEASPAPQLVLAGPGTGKTRVLVYRAAYLLLRPDEPLAPEELVVITFTTKAAAQLRDRLHALIGADAQFVRAGTIHHFCYELLRAHHDRLGLPPHFIVADDAISDAFWQPWCDRNGYRNGHQRVRLKVSRYKLEIDTLPRDLLGATQRYQQMLTDRGAVDYDDLLVYARDLLRDHEDVREAVRRQTGALLVDEFQDTDPVQYHVIRSAMCPERRGLFCVADDDQSIYGFRGAQPENVRAYQHAFGCSREDGTLHVLDWNYRSNTFIFKSAESVLDGGVRLKRTGEVHALSQAGAPVEIAPCATEADELAFVMRTVRRWVEDEGVPRHEVAVLTPWNRLNSTVEDRFLRAGIPCDVSGTDRLLATRVMRRLHALLLFVHKTRTDQPSEAELEELLGHLLDQRAAGAVAALASRVAGTRQPFAQAFHKLATDPSARAHAGLDEQDREQIDAAFALVTNTLARAAQPETTVGDLVGWLLPKLDGPLQLLARHEHALADPDDVSSIAAAGRTLRRLLEAGPEDGGRLVVHHTSAHVGGLWATLARHALREHAAATPDGGTVEVHELRGLRRQRAPLSRRDVVITDAPADFSKQAGRARLLSRERGLPAVLNLHPEAARQATLALHRTPSVLDVDAEGRYESPAVRLFKVLQAALARPPAPLYPAYVMVDVETTGLDPKQCRVAEIGALEVVDGEAARRFETLVALPDDLSPNEAGVLRDVCGLDPADFDEAPSERDAWRAFCAFADDRPLVAHNGQRFDFRVLARLKKKYAGEVDARWGIVHDMLPDAKELFPGLPSYSAEALRRTLLEDDGETAHRALADCEDQQRLLAHLQAARARRGRKLLLEPLLPAVAAAMLHEPETRLQDPESEEAVFLRTGYLWAIRGGHALLADLRALPGHVDVAEAVRSNRRFFELVKEAPFQLDRRVPLDLEARIDALVAPYADAKITADGLADLLVHLALWGARAADQAGDVVYVSTYHSAKGLEFERVLCMHVHDGAFPAYYLETDEDRSESRRLLYVGMTRAMTHLVITYPQQSHDRRRRESPFLDRISADHARRLDVFRAPP